MIEYLFYWKLVDNNGVGTLRFEFFHWKTLQRTDDRN